MIIRARAPLRLGLAGGGTDVSPFSDQYGGYVLNATINQYVYAMIEDTSHDMTIEFVATDQALSAKYEVEPFLEIDGVLDLHKAVYNRIIRQFNDGKSIPLRITTFSDVPAGSGLGSSSALVVAMVKAFVEWMKLPLGEYDIAHLAFEIERNDAGLSGGKQDQYAATFGGFNFIEFHADNRVIVNPLRIKNWIISELESSIVLFFTGKPRDSAAIINEQSANVSQGNQSSINAMLELKQEALRTKELLLKGDFKGLAESINGGWASKKRTAHSITNAHIDNAYDVALRAGAVAGKISGAGGGGFMMFIVDPARRIQVINVLSEIEGWVVPCNFTKHGTQGWQIG